MKNCSFLYFFKKLTFAETKLEVYALALVTLKCLLQLNLLGVGIFVRSKDLIVVCFALYHLLSNQVYPLLAVKP